MRKHRQKLFWPCSTNLWRGRLSGKRCVKEIVQKDVDTDLIFLKAEGIHKEKGFRRAQLIVVLLSEQCFQH